MLWWLQERQAIIWTNAHLIHWRIYTGTGGRWVKLIEGLRDQLCVLKYLPLHDKGPRHSAPHWLVNTSGLWGDIYFKFSRDSEHATPPHKIIGEPVDKTPSHEWFMKLGCFDGGLLVLYILASCGSLVISSGRRAVFIVLDAVIGMPIANIGEQDLSHSLSQGSAWPGLLITQDTEGQQLISYGLTHWGWDKMATIFRVTFSNAFSQIEFWLTFHWSLFLRVRLTIFQHWFR